MTTSECIERLKQQGNEAFQRGDYHEAVRVFSLAIDADPTHHVLWSNRSAARASLREYGLALTDAEEAIRLAPSWAKGHGRKAAALAGMGDCEKAKEAYEEALRLEPGSVQMLQGLKQCIDAIAGGKQHPQPSASRRNPFAAPDLIQRLLKNPKTAAYMNDPSFVHTIRELQQDKAGSEAIARHLGDQRVLDALAVAMGIDLDVLKTAQSPSPSEKAQKDEKLGGTGAKEASASGEAGKAVLTEEQQLFLEEKEKGNAAYKEKDFEAALVHYRRAAELDSSNMSVLTNEAAVHFECQRWDDAIEACLRAVDVGREARAPFEQISKAFSRAAAAAHRKDDLDTAIRFYNKALAEHRTADALTRLKECERERDARAKTAYRDPHVAEQEREAGNALFREGRFADAVPRYTEAIRRMDDDVRAYSNRSACYTKLGAIPEAIRDAETCIRLDPSFIKAYIRKANAELLKRDCEACLATCQLALSKDTTGGHASEIQAIQMRCIADSRRTKDDSESGLTEEQRVQRAIERDPELRQIVSDPTMRLILQQMQSDPQAVQEHMRSPQVAVKIRKLISAGIIRTG